MHCVLQILRKALQVYRTPRSQGRSSVERSHLQTLRFLLLLRLRGLVLLLLREQPSPSRRMRRRLPPKGKPESRQAFSQALQVLFRPEPRCDVSACIEQKVRKPLLFLHPLTLLLLQLVQNGRREHPNQAPRKPAVSVVEVFARSKQLHTLRTQRDRLTRRQPEQSPDESLHATLAHTIVALDPHGLEDPPQDCMVRILQLLLHPFILPSRQCPKQQRAAFLGPVRLLHFFLCDRKINTRQLCPLPPKESKHETLQILEMNKPHRLLAGVAFPGPFSRPPMSSVSDPQVLEDCAHGVLTRRLHS